MKNRTSFIKSVSGVCAGAGRGREDAASRGEVIPQVRPATPPPCLLLISGHRGGTFELALFVLADNTPPPPRVWLRSRPVTTPAQLEYATRIINCCYLT